jgi:hypothetical protein
MGTLATESIVKISIAWTGGTVVYADKTATGEKGTILEFDVVALQGQVGASGSIGSVNVKLDDTDGTLKTIHDGTIIEGTPVTITQVSTGGVSKTRTLLVGKICADVVWSEGERSLSFGVESVYKDQQIGYAPASGDYAWLHPDMVGVVWPLCFGSVLRAPAVHALHPYDLTLAEDADYDSATFEINNGDTLPQHPTSIRIEISEVLFDGTMSGNIFTPTVKNAAKYSNVEIAARVADGDEKNPCVFWLKNNENLLRHFCLVCFDGSNYTVNQVTHQEGKKCFCAKPWDGDILLDATYSILSVARYPKTSWPETMIFTSDGSGSNLLTIAKDGWKLLKDAVVTYRPVSGITDRYICNLVPSYAVYEVFAHRTFFGRKIFCAVPSSYYTVNLSETLGARSVTTITMTQSLSDRYCEGWDNDLYVSLISNTPTVDGGDEDHGANTADIIEWILETYTTITADPTSFASVKVSLADYPSNFTIFDQPNAVEVCKEIAWQARCSLTILNGVAYLTYLPSIGTATPVESFTSELTEFRSLSLGFASTDDLITKIKATWVREYSGEPLGVDGLKPEREYTNSLNTSLGLFEMEKNFFIYNIVANVQASVDFWLRRMANIWRTISCRVFIDVDDLLVFDPVLFDQTGLNFPSGGALGQLTYIGHNTGEPLIEIQAQLAIKAGSMLNSSDYWTVGSGVVEDIRDSLAQYDYEVSSDNACPNYVEAVTLQRKKYYYVFTETPKRIVRNIPFVFKAEIQDADGNLITEIDPAFATLALHNAHPKDNGVPNSIDMIFIGGKWDNAAAPITVNGGDKHSILHIWIESKDSRILSSNKKIGSN